MDKKKIGLIAGAVLAAGFVIFLLFKLISLLLSLMGGALDFVIGLVVVIALVGLVIWMFAYARNKRK